MPRVTLQVHPLAYARIKEQGVDHVRGTGRTTTIILEGIVRLQKEGYTSDTGVCVQDHYQGTQANLNVFTDYVRTIIRRLDMAKHIAVVQHSSCVELKWKPYDETN